MVAAQFGIARRVLVPLIALAVGQVGQVGQRALARLPRVPRPSHLSAVVGQLMRRFVPRQVLGGTTVGRGKPAWILAAPLVPRVPPTFHGGCTTAGLTSESVAH